MDQNSRTDRPGVKTVGAAQLTIALLRCLARQRGPVGVTPLAKQVGRYPGTVYAVLKTLQAEGVVEFNPASKTYQLSVGGVLEISRLPRQEELSRRVEPLMRQVSERFEISVYLSQRVRSDTMVVIACTVPDLPFGLVTRVGHRFAMPLGGSGRIIVGLESDNETYLRAAYDRVIWRRRHIPFEEWVDQVAQDRERGYAYEEDSLSEGLATLAVPVHRSGLPANHVLSAIAPRGELAEPRRQAIVAALQDLAEAALPFV